MTRKALGTLAATLMALATASTLIAGEDAINLLDQTAMQQPSLPGGVMVLPVPSDAGQAVGQSTVSAPQGYTALPCVIIRESSTGRIIMILVFPQTQAAQAQPQQQQAGNGMTPKNEMGFVDVFTSLNVRTGPGIENQRIGGLPPGARVHIVGERNGWYLIDYQGRQAWVCGKYVNVRGEQVRNPAINDNIGDYYRGIGRPDLAPKPAPRPADASPAPSGSQAGQRSSDGGLKVPLFCQSRINARVPGGFCGPTSLKMTLAYYGINKDINFLGDANVGGATPVYRSGQGAGHQAMLDMLRHCGLKNSQMTHGNSISWLKQQTDQGHPVVVSVRGNYGPRSTNGHILVVVGVTANGDVIINDSADGKRHVCPGRTFYNAWSSSSRMGIVAKP